MLKVNTQKKDFLKEIQKKAGKQIVRKMKFYTI